VPIVLDLKAVALTEGDSEAECTLIVSDDVMVQLGTGQLAAKDALAQDKIDIDGHLELIYLLEPFIASLK
jgi:ubiquinone biosynthesis protein UbiJ